MNTNEKEGFVYNEFVHIVHTVKLVLVTTYLCFQISRLKDNDYQISLHSILYEN